MGKSYRKTPICGITTSETEKWWKRQCHKRARVAERAALASLDDQIEDPAKGAWGPKDGKQWIGSNRDQWWQPEIDKAMRK